ncbi:MAG: hypothetical protein IPJ03_14425 [Ignavibacteriales bacterium]|nr:hypothetical protein [Ignavibacteriales bacterium]
MILTIRVSISKANKYFPELLIFYSTNLDQSSKYPAQLFSFTDNKWKKYDSFEAGPGTEINEGVLMNTSKGIGINYLNYSKMLTSKDGLLLTQAGIPTLFTDYNGMVWISYSYTALPAYSASYNVGLMFGTEKNYVRLQRKTDLQVI